MSRPGFYPTKTKRIRQISCESSGSARFVCLVGCTLLLRKGFRERQPVARIQQIQRLDSPVKPWLRSIYRRSMDVLPAR
jgi:hypothetical protein